MGDIFPLNRISNWNLHFQPEFFFWRPLNSNLWEVNSFLNRTLLNRIWALQSFVGERISLEPDFKLESFLMTRIFFIEPGFCNCDILFNPEIFWQHDVNPGPGYLSLQRIGVLEFTENRQRLLSHIIVAPKSQGDSRSWLEILHTWLWYKPT